MQNTADAKIIWYLVLNVAGAMQRAMTVVRAAASSWKPRSLTVAWMDRRSPVAWPGLVDGALL